MPRTAFYFIWSATTGFTVNAFPYPSRVSLKLKETFAVLELCAGKLACTVLRGRDPSNGVWLLGALQLCQKAGLVKLGHVAIDGTKMQANASKHKAMSYGRMGEAEQKLQAEVEALLRHAEEVIGIGAAVAR